MPGLLLLAASLLSLAARAADPCASPTVAPVGDLAAIVAAAAPPAAPDEPAVERTPENAPFLALLARNDRTALARLADERPGAFALATPEERARVITLMQQGGTGDTEERAIENLLKTADPLQRHRVLRLVDQGGDTYDLRHLVFEDVDEAGRRSRILDLIREAGRAAKEAGILEVGIISDVDDTASVQHGPHTDGRIPGVAVLFAAIEAGPTGSGSAGDVHYVTGRPPAFNGDVDRRLGKAGVPAGTMNDGSLGEVILGGVEGIAKEKIRDITRLLELHPEQRFVLFGDDRQRDPEVYRAIQQAYPDRVAAVFIRRAGGKVRNPEEYEGIRFVDGYDQAADALRGSAISPEQAEDVREAVEGAAKPPRS